MKQQQFTKEDYVLLAKLAQQTQRYQQMINFADQLLLSDTELNPQERNLCSSAYKNVVGNKRAQLKVLNSMRKNTPGKDTDNIFNVIDKYENHVKEELVSYCCRILKIIDTEILYPKSTHQTKSIEAKIFYLKMKADYNRYLCEFSNMSQNKYEQIANNCYDQADTLARSNLPQTHPVRLSLHLNMSVFLFENRNEPERAIQLANRAFEEAIANIDTVNQENYKQCTMILQLMRDNITLWSGENQ